MGGGRCRSHPYLIPAFLRPLPLSSPPAGRWRGWLAYSPSFPCFFFSFSHLFVYLPIASCGAGGRLSRSSGGAFFGQAGWRTLLLRLSIMQTFCFLLCPSPPVGPLAEPPPVLIHIHNCAAGDSHISQNGAGDSAAVAQRRGELGNRKGRKWAGLRSTIIANYQAAKTCKNS